MPQLRHLVSDAHFRLPHSPDGSNLPLENLQTLSPVVNLVWNEKILQMIPNVKRLGLIYTNVNEDYYLHLLKFLDRLEKLELILDFSWRIKNPAFPKTLRKLILVRGEFPWKDMGIIGSLPCLQVLKLLVRAFEGETWETTNEEFPQLQYLLIHQSDPEEWITQSSHFPRLKSLVLRSCWRLMEIPQISTLELIEMDENCAKSLLKSAKQIKYYQESNKNYTLQVRLHSDELRDKPDKQPSTEELQSAERKAQVMHVATPKETTEIKELQSAERKAQIMDVATGMETTEIEELKSVERKAQVMDMATGKETTEIEELQSAEKKAQIMDVATGKETTEMEQLQYAKRKVQVTDVATGMETTEIEELQSAERKAQIIDVATGKETTEIEELQSAQRKTQVMDVATRMETIEIEDLQSA